MDFPRLRQSDVLAALALLAILVLGWRIHWVQADLIQIEYDDLLLMSGSRSIDAGESRWIWAPQHIHWIPLFRLLRLPFDLNFPAWHVRFHATVVAAHLAAAAALFLLARRHLQSRWAALATALLFAWSTVGDEALVWKAASPFVFSWALLLLGMWLLTLRTVPCVAAGFLLLLASVGIFSGMLFVIPGVAAAIVILKPNLPRRALFSAAAAWVVGSAAWVAFVGTSGALAHYWSYGDSGTGLLARLWTAALDTARAYGFQLQLGLWFGGVNIAIPAALIGVSLILLRRHANWRWILAALLLTFPLLFVMMFIRKQEAIWKISRYGYQSYTFWAIIPGALLDATLHRLESMPRWKSALGALLLPFAAFYFSGHLEVARHHRDHLAIRPTGSQAFWFGWDSFFRLTSAHRAEIGRPLRLPAVDLPAGLYLPTVYMLCHPRGLPWLIAEHDVVGTEEQQQEFLLEVQRVRHQSAVFNQVEIPVLAAAGEPHRH